MPKAELLDEAKCNEQCPGNSKDKCGGKMAVTVYAGSGGGGGGGSMTMTKTKVQPIKQSKYKIRRLPDYGTPGTVKVNFSGNKLILLRTKQ